MFAALFSVLLILTGSILDSWITQIKLYNGLRVRSVSQLQMGGNVELFAEACGADRSFRCKNPLQCVLYRW